MDVFKYLGTPNGSPFTNPVNVGNILSKTWIERFSSNGEFTFVGNLADGLGEELPRGTFVSHTLTGQVMVVEDHQIKEDSDNGNTITITGRSFETFLDNRIAGSNIIFPYYGELPEYTLWSGYPWGQAIRLLTNTLNEETLHDSRNVLPHIDISYQFDGVEPTKGENKTRTIPPSPLYSQVRSLLNESDAGIRSIRSYFGAWPGRIILQVYTGRDLSESVYFTTEKGDFESADYLWSNQTYKNCAMVTCKWFSIMVGDSQLSYDRKMAFIDAKDYTLFHSYLAAGGAPPSTWEPWEREFELQKFTEYANKRFSRLKETFVINPQPTPDDGGWESRRYRVYGSGYDIGDIITVVGRYGEPTKMRVIEYVESEENGLSSGAPTLAAYKGDLE